MSGESSTGGLRRRIRFVVFRYSHHSPHSGYSRLAEYGVKQYPAEVIRILKPLPKAIIRERILWRLAEGTPGYTRASMAAELKVAWKILNERDWIYHFLYGETTYHYAGQLNNLKNNRLVATFHLPPVGIQKSVQIDWHLKQLSAAICVGTSQQEYLSRIIGPERVFFGPLGVDLEYYTPPPVFDTRDPDLCIFVGENYRDFPSLRGVIELVTDKRPGTKFVGVVPPKCNDLIGVHPNLTLRSGVPEEELLALYRSASLMVLPLKDATANNAVLEGMACGLPQVITDVGSTRDYVSPDCAVLTPLNDARKMAYTILELLDAPDELRRMSEKATKQAAQFSWPNVVKQLDEVYSSLT
jgi:glycosyltransferase involved in cell wall biosynthesis